MFVQNFTSKFMAQNFFWKVSMSLCRQQNDVTNDF